MGKSKEQRLDTKGAMRGWVMEAETGEEKKEEVGKVVTCWKRKRQRPFSRHQGCPVGVDP